MGRWWRYKWITFHPSWTRALDVRLPEQFSIIGKLRARYPV
ncbi:ATP-binding protein, partial [Escherichia coli]|nr:ATP-binding protein [Escherichia coli]